MPTREQFYRIFGVYPEQCGVDINNPWAVAAWFE